MGRKETCDGFVVLPMPTYKTSAKEFAEKNGVDYPTAQGFIKYLVKCGVASSLPARKVEGQKGKPTNMYELPIEVRVELAA